MRRDRPVSALKLNFKIFKKISSFFSQKGPKFRQRFLCEVRVPGFPYVGAGNSTNKKDAEKNSARDFINFLVRSGKVNQNEVPGADEGGPTGNEMGDQQQPPQQQQYNYNQQHNSGNLSNFSPNQLGQAYRPYGNQRDDFGPQSYMDRAKEQAKMEEAESFDSNAGIHGNWTLENAKSKLNQFMQASKIPGEFKYSAIGPDHNR